MLAQRAYSNDCQLGRIPDPRECIVKVWETIKHYLCCNLSESMRNVCFATLKDQDNTTNYLDAFNSKISNTN